LNALVVFCAFPCPLTFPPSSDVLPLVVSLGVLPVLVLWLVPLDVLPNDRPPCPFHRDLVLVLLGDLVPPSDLPYPFRQMNDLRPSHRKSVHHPFRQTSVPRTNLLCYYLAFNFLLYDLTS